jgi:hypothetical protein
MNAEQIKIWNDPLFATIRPIAEGYGFCLDDQQSFNGEAVFYRGSSTNDYFIILYRSQPDRLDMRIINYEKKLASQPFGTDPDTIRRFTLFSGVVGNSDVSAIRAILQSTVGVVK